MPSGSVLVTGASSGIGLQTALHLHANGWRVFGGIRNPGRAEALAKAGVEVVPLDVTDEEQTRAAVATVVRKCGAIDALVNNAGIQVRGYFEDVPEADVRAVFETNVFGVMRVTRAVLPFMREERRGRIVMVGSIGGRIGSLALTSYCASKFALEGFAESLALEVAPLQISVSLVAPAMVRTDIWGANRNVAKAAADPKSFYYAWFSESERLADRILKTAPTTPADVAEAVARALTDTPPRLRYIVGRRAGWLLRARNLLPGEMFEKIYFRQVLRMVTKPR